MGDMGSENRPREVKLQKSYFDVLGLCCTSEVPLVEKILQPLAGIEKVSVIVPSKTVIVVHDTLLISQLQIEKALNQARLEASIRSYGAEKIIKKWPSPYILACGTLLVVSLFQHVFRPLKWSAVAAVVVGAPPIVLRSFAALRKYTFDINILMLIAVGGAIAMKDYTEAGFIVFLFTVAEWLETRASHKATAGMSSLMSMAPQKAVLAETGQVVDAADVKLNTILAIKAGEVIPIDGIVVEGRSDVDEKMLTGESFPVAKQDESLVWAGTLNIDGYISVKTTALAENSAVAKMARLVEEAQNSRSKTQRLIDSCAKYYTPAVVVLAVGVAVVPRLVGAHRSMKWFKLALVLLVSACPCALVLSTPVATFCSLLKAARMGLLIKGGDVLEALAKTRVVALDKTGTITRGEFVVMDFRPIDNDITLEKLLYWVSSLESKSSHPMAAALVDYARSNSIEPKPENVTGFCIYPGEGICGEIDGRKIYAGNRRLATRAACQTVPKMEDIGVTVGYVFSDAVPIGIFTLSDTCRTGAAEAIRELKSLGIKTAMVTGDSSAASKHAQNQLGGAIELIHAELLPEDKVRIIKDLKTKEGSTTMVGDGMNDAPALAEANVGISMGISGSAVAMETSHITLMSNDVRKLPKAIKLARRTHRKIIINILFSVGTKIAILALAFAGYPLLWAAVLADVGTCLAVILNSMMLLQTRKQKEKKCCGSSHKLHTPRPARTGRCSRDTCGSQNIQCQSSVESRSHNNGCHSHDKEMNGKTHGNCSAHCSRGTCESQTIHYQSSEKSCLHNGCHNLDKEMDGRTHGECLSSCEKQDCHKDPLNHSHRNPELIPGASKATHEHLISISCEEDHHETVSHEHSGKLIHCNLEVVDVHENPKAPISCGNQPLGDTCMFSHLCKDTDKRQVGGCCGAPTKVCGKKDGYLLSDGCNDTKEVGECCRREKKGCVRKDSPSPSLACMDMRESGGCCRSERNRHEKEDDCLSSQICMNNREVGACCTSYRKEHVMKDGCCGGRTLQLPEIIVD